MQLLPFVSTFLMVGLAELADKTQLLTIALASKYPMEKVLYGVIAGASASMLLAVMLGGLIHQLIPPILISVLAGAFFIIYGLMMIVPVKGEEEYKESRIFGSNPFLIVFGSIFLAELGDKTQLATLALSAKYSSPLMVWAGATLGMIVVNLFGIVIGNVISNYLPEKTSNFIAGCIFIAFGAITFLSILFKV